MALAHSTQEELYSMLVVNSRSVGKTLNFKETIERFAEQYNKIEVVEPLTIKEADDLITAMSFGIMAMNEKTKKDKMVVDALSEIIADFIEAEEPCKILTYSLNPTEILVGADTRAKECLQERGIEIEHTTIVRAINVGKGTSEGGLSFKMVTVSGFGKVELIHSVDMEDIKELVLESEQAYLIVVEEETFKISVEKVYVHDGSSYPEQAYVHQIL